MKKERIRNKFLEELRRVPVVRVACKNSGISHNSVYRWYNEDPEFKKDMDQALSEGEDMINDLAESKLLTLINDTHFSAIRFWLTSRHSAYRQPSRATIREAILEQEIEKRKREEADEMMRVLGLTIKDFSDENRGETSKKIAEYLRSR